MGKLRDLVDRKMVALYHHAWDAFFLGCLLSTAGFLYNVYSDPNGLQVTAHAAVCAPRGTCRLARIERGPLVQLVTFQNRGEPPMLASCRRELVFLGEWKCTKE